MNTRTGLKDFAWMAAGAAITLAIILIVLYLQAEQNPAAQLVLKNQKSQLVEQMRLALASASEAQKSAVMATTTQDSLNFADQARAAAAEVEHAAGQLRELLQTHGTGNEEKLLGQFSQAFAEYQRIDKVLLDMAVQNTNLKAYSLAFGPAAEVLREMDAALARLAAENAGSSSPEARQVAQLADDARIRALRIQALLAPHIAEESDQKMDELEARMANEDLRVRQDLEGLAARLKPGTNPDIETATSYYARFSELKAQIIKLSRENTNVRSLAISLNEKRRVMLMCQDALAALEQAIEQEPVPGITYGTPVHPR